MSASPVEPAADLTDLAALPVAYLDFYRDLVPWKLDGMSERALRTSLVPSGWSPLELVHHLTWVERRWVRWGFLGEDIGPPWGDEDDSGRWHVPADRSAGDILQEYADEIRHGREVLAEHALSEIGQPGPRWRDPQRPATLGWVVFHLLQEYARHVGHLDIARELADGRTGESGEDEPELP